MMLLWACAGVPLGAYNIVNNFNIALRIQPQILTVLSLGTWGQCFYYDDVSLFFLFFKIWRMNFWSEWGLGEEADRT